MSRPHLSVLIDTYNQARFLPRALDSVLDQHDVDWARTEVLVVDDGSTDGTADVLAGYGDRVRVLRKANGGQASAFNLGLDACRGDLVALLDGDDWWAPNKLATVLAAFAADPELGALGHGFVEVDDATGAATPVRPAQRLRFDLRDAAGAHTFALHKAFLGTSRFAARRALLARCGPVPEALVFEADEYLFTQVGALAPVAILPQPLTYYRLHGQNLFQASAAAARDRSRRERRHAVFQCLVETLPAALDRHGVPPGVQDVALEPARLETARLALELGHGGRREAFDWQRRSNRLRTRGGGLRYRAFKAGTLALSLLLPPRWYLDLQHRYARGGPRLRRRLAGDAATTGQVRRGDDDDAPNR